MTYSVTKAFCTETKFNFYVFFSAFKDQPETPPSRAQAMIRQGQSDSNDNVDYAASIKRLMTNRGYVLLLITYGLNVGVFYAISTLLNSVILMHFEVGIIQLLYDGCYELSTSTSVSVILSFLLRVQRSTLGELVSLLSFVAWLDRWCVASSWIKRMLTSM